MKNESLIIDDITEDFFGIDQSIKDALHKNPELSNEPIGQKIRSGEFFKEAIYNYLLLFLKEYINLFI